MKKIYSLLSLIGYLFIETLISFILIYFPYILISRFFKWETLPFYIIFIIIFILKVILTSNYSSTILVEDELKNNNSKRLLND